MVILNVDPTKGIHKGTDLNGSNQIILAPMPLFTTFPGDTSVWQVNGDAWTIDGDKASLNNPNGNNDFLNAIFGITQAAANPVTFRVIASGNVPPPLGEWSISLTLTDAGGLGGTILGHQEVSFPSGKFDETQISVTITPSAPAHYLYAYIFCRNSLGSIALRNADVYEHNGSSRNYGVWESEAFDIFQLTNTPIATSGLGMTKAYFYYSDLDNVDYASSVEHSIEMLSNFDILVCNEPGLNSTARQQYVQQQLIANGVRLYGYANVGVSVSDWNGCHPLNSVITAIIDRCAAAGYTGVFFDAFGCPGVPTEQQNYLINYAHSNNLNVIGNCHPGDILGNTVSSDVTPTPTTAPALTAVPGPSTLPAGTYQVCWTRTSYNGETPPTPAAPITITAGQGIQVSNMSGGFDNCYGVNVYMSDAPGSNTLRLINQGQGFTFNITALPPSTAQTPPATNTAYAGNHLGISSLLGSNDWLLWESFYSRSDNQYAGVPEGGFAIVFGSYLSGMQLARSAGVNVMALVYALSSIPINSFSDVANAYLLAIGLGLKGFSYTGQSLGHEVEWFDYPTVSVGRTLTQMFQADGNQYLAETDAGTIWFQATDSPVARSSGTFLTTGSFTASFGSVPVVQATRIESTWQTSADQVNWTDVDGQSFFVTSANNRYFRYRVVLRS